MSGFESTTTGGIYEQKASNQHSTNKSEYTLGRGIVAEKSIEPMGTKAGLNIIKLTSGYGESDDLWKLSQIVNPANVTKLKSNCNSMDVSTGGGESSGDSGDTDVWSTLKNGKEVTCTFS